MKNEKFAGIGFKLLTIRANEFDGFGMSFFEIKWNTVKLVTISHSKTLLHFNFYMKHNNGGKELCLYGGVFFFSFKLFSKILIPKKDRCVICGELCMTNAYYNDNVSYCSAYCRD